MGELVVRDAAGCLERVECDRRRPGLRRAIGRLGHVACSRTFGPTRQDSPIFQVGLTFCILWFVATDSARAGRPRSFDEDQIVDDALAIFWSHGNNTTTRVLESELGITQSSIYNAFGSKQGLLDRALDRYVERIDAEVVTPLDSPGASRTELLAFVDRLMAWIGAPGRPGCLLLNMLGERQTADPSLIKRANDYRERLRQVFVGALEPHGKEQSALRAEVLLASVLGINISAYGGAPADELAALANGLRAQITDWTAA